MVDLVAAKRCSPRHVCTTSGGSGKAKGDAGSTSSAHRLHQSTTRVGVMHTHTHTHIHTHSHTHIHVHCGWKANREFSKCSKCNDYFLSLREQNKRKTTQTLMILDWMMWTRGDGVRASDAPIHVCITLPCGKRNVTNKTRGVYFSEDKEKKGDDTNTRH
mmetsp:Transcript_31365/g.50678  ORF Transcript_31365/g.50678 Transcript_31365/m.50678 type:complete len:160 (+) Transcript_31365:246-725(+)